MFLIVWIFIKFSEDPNFIDLFFIKFISIIRSSSLNSMMIQYGSLEAPTLIISIIVILAILVLICVRARAFAVFILVNSLGSPMIIYCLKHLVNRDRPPSSLWLVEAHGTSFPSGHAVAFTALFFTLTWICTRFVSVIWVRVVLSIFFFSLALGVGFSRMYLGVHYFCDVIAGMFLGVAWTYLSLLSCQIIGILTHQSMNR